MSIAAGTVALYRFENNGNDSSGNGHNLTMNGTVPFSNSDFIKGAYAAGPYTDTNFWIAPASLLTAWAGLSTWTVEFWYHANTAHSARIPWSWQGDAALYALEVGTAAGTMQVDVGAGIRSNNYTFNEWDWVHFMVVGTGSRVKGYRNGVLVADLAFTGTTGATVSNMVIGRYYAAGGYASPGLMDEFRFSNIARTVPTWDTNSTLTVSASTATTATLAWTQTAGCSFQRIYRGTSPTFASATSVGSVMAGVETFTDRGLSAGTQYYWWVEAYRTVGDRSIMVERSESATATIALPAAPTNLAAGTATISTIPLTWTDAAGTGQVLVYRNTTNNSATASLVGAALAGVQAFSDDCLTPATPYFYWVKAVGTDGSISTFSTVATATTATGTAPTAPTGLTGETVSASSLKLDWSDGANTDYLVVLRSTSPTLASAVVIDAVDAGTETITDTGLTAATTYYYWLRPFNSINEPGPEASTSATTEAAPVVPVRQDRDYLGPLQTAVYTRLAAAGITYTNRKKNPATTEAVPVYDLPDEDASLPLILAGEISSQEPANTKNRRGQRCIYTAHVVSEYRGHLEASEIANKVMLALSSSKLDLSADGLVISVQKGLNVQARELPDASTIDWAVQIFLEIYETATVEIGGA